MTRVQWKAYVVPGGAEVDVVADNDSTTPVLSIESPSDLSGGGASVTVAEADPGAIGAGNMWVRLDPSQSYPPSLYIRDAQDDGWVDDDNAGYLLSQGLTYYDGSDDIRSVIDLGTSVNISTLDAGGDQTLLVEFEGSNRRLSIGGTNPVHIALNGRNILTGVAGVDPTAGAGIAAPTGSLYLYANVGDTVGRLYIKTGATDTAWGLVTTT